MALSIMSVLIALKAYGINDMIKRIMKKIFLLVHIKNGESKTFSKEGNFINKWIMRK